MQRFYEENNELMAYPQYEAAKDDPKYFLGLVQLACQFHEEDETEGKEVLH